MLVEIVFEFIKEQGPVTLSTIQEEYFDNHGAVYLAVKALENGNMIKKEWRSTQPTETKPSAQFQVWMAS